MHKYLMLFLVCALFSCNKEDISVDSCDISNLEISTLSCNSDSTYSLKIEFSHPNNLNGEYFDVFVRNDELIGHYSIDSLPITIPNFERSGAKNDFIKICINDRPNCCLVEEFSPPYCDDDSLEIHSIETQIGACTSDSTYSLTVNFQASNASTNSHFNLYVRGGQLVGNYAVSDLPLTIPNFHKSGLTYDFIKICIDGFPESCEEHEFLPPTCETGECAINDLELIPLECTSDSTYNLKVNFRADNPGNDYFDVYVRNGVSLGYYKLSDLPITLKNFPLSGKEYDFVKVCINDHPNCCAAEEVLSPTCSTEACSIRDLSVDQGTCTSDTTYKLTINFIADNPGNDYFDVYVRNGVFLGYYKLSDLPITIDYFPVSGKDSDFLKICINDRPNCCQAIEFLTKDCK